MKTDMTPPLRLLKLALAIGLACWLTSCISDSQASSKSSSSADNPNSCNLPQSNNAAGKGQRVYLTWNNPTTNADGSRLDPSTLQGYIMAYSKSGGTPVPKRFDLPHGANSWESQCLPRGTYTFSVSVFDHSGASVYSKKLTVEL